MRLQIEFNDAYAQRLLNDQTFISNLITIHNSDGAITEIWIEDAVANNDELTFRMQALSMVQSHFCRIFNVDVKTTEVANNDSNMLAFLIRYGTTNQNRLIASIVNVL